MRGLILLPCSGSKQAGGISAYDRNRSVLHALPKDQGDQLLKLRRELFAYYKDIVPGYELYRPDQQVMISGRLEYMAAYERYSAQKSLIYGQVRPETWGLLGATEDVCVLIISALYGVLQYDEPIQKYNRAMDKDRVGEVKLQNWWKQHGLAEIVKAFIASQNIGRVYSFLSKPYAEAIDLYRLGANVEDFPELKCGIGTLRRRGERFEALVNELPGNPKTQDMCLGKETNRNEGRLTGFSAPSQRNNLGYTKPTENHNGNISSRNLRNGGNKKSQYAALVDYLERQVGRTVRLSFDEIETIMGVPLPPSARKYAAWWANDKSHSHCIWTDVGWRTNKLDLRGEMISFEKLPQC